ncbi:MAG: MAM domain protein [Candidatus Cloacimonetes bacterium ADurb.Bin211]|nr:MAG: MAM domain protein [Candidatus Cloacimonetes bacterium ADurb.Bin211]
MSFIVPPPTQSTTVLNESFENGGSIPSGWTQTYVNGSIAWTFTTGGFNGHPSSAYNGTYNARFYYSSRVGYTTKLITPSLNLSGAETATLTFWHTQEAWSGDQDQLKVYYRTSTTGNWNLITSYTNSIANWTQETISLPNLSSTYYIAFEGIANYGYGVCLDKVVVSKNSYVNLPTWLTVASGSSYSGSIAYNEPAQNIPIGFNSTGLSLGTYNTNLTISSNDPVNSSITIPVTLTVTSISVPVIVVNPLAINFGTVAVNSIVQEQFSIQNTGNAVLSGNISTPLGYSVIEATSKGKNIVLASRQNDDTRNTVSYSINPSSSKIYNLIFTPASATTYSGNVVITSNDPNNPSLNIAVTGSGYTPNAPPAIDLPESFSFIKNGTLQVDFSSYIYDADNDELQINYSGNNNILIQIQNYLVTFSAPVNWTGSETVTFSVSDGSAIAYDPVEVIVYPSPMPDWNVVVYPNNSATVYSIVTIDGEPCELNDWVGAFVGNECRGMAEVVTDNGIAYTTLLVNLATDSENISFKIFACSTETVYPVLETYNLHFGEELGPINLNGVSSIELNSPIINLSTSAQGYLLSWNAVPYANQYKIYRSIVNPYEGFELIATVSTLQYIDSEVHNKAFYYVKAVNNQISKK